MIQAELVQTTDVLNSKLAELLHLLLSRWFQKSYLCLFHTVPILEMSLAAEWFRFAADSVFGSLSSV